MSARLVVVAGPNKGATYFLKEGQNIIGRGAEADVLLENSQVSKRHCIVHFISGKAEVLDAGSSNGTYVNGVLVKKKKLRVGDKISIGPFVFEIIAGATEKAEDSADVAMGNIANVTANSNVGAAVAMPRSEREKSIFRKIYYKFDEVVPPVIIDFNARHEWWVIATGLFILYIFFYIGLSVYPLLDTARETVLQEAERRAFYIARQIADLNQEALANGQESLLSVDFAEKDQSVAEALIVDLTGRVLAPGARVNETSNNPFIVKHLAAIREGNQKSWRLLNRRNEDATKVIVTVPIFVRAPKSGLNVPKALVAVTFLLKGITLDSGTIGVVYFESLIIALMLGIFYIYLLYRFTYHSITTLNDDMDNVLKGNQPSIPKRFKFFPLEKLIDSINSALSRIPSLKVDDSEQGPATSDSEQQIIDSMIAPVHLLITKATVPMLLLGVDTKVITMNTPFEELTGIHLDSAAQQPVAEVSRDDAFAAMMSDMINKAPGAGLQGVIEDFEFGSGLHKVFCYAIFSLPEKVEAFLITIEAEKGEEEDG